MKKFQLFINGEWLDSKSGEVFESINPATLEVIAEVQKGNAEDVDLAVKAAKVAFENEEWREMIPADRARLLYQMASKIRENKTELAALETADVGKPIGQSENDVEVAARYFEYYAGVADKILGETIPVRPDILDYTLREPFGVTVHIVPWNYPIQMLSRSLAPALAAGNTTVVKPAEDTPVNALKLAEIAQEVGFPKGVINIITGFGYDAGAALASHDDIDHITFTGSVATGSAVMKTAAEKIKSLTLELGGKSPNIVFEDADLDDASDWVVKSITQNAGQTCAAGARLIVADTIKDSFVDLVKYKMEALTIGAGMERHDLGPIVSEKQVANIEKYMDIAVEEGSPIILGGKRKTIKNSNLYFEPTVIQAVSPTCRLAQEEIFGPVLVVIPFTDKEEALQLANNTEYGLVTGIWTNDINKALWMAHRVRSGQVFINNYGAGGGVEMPFGGTGKSGFGREKGLEALKHYTQLKNIAIKINK